MNQKKQWFQKNKYPLTECQKEINKNKNFRYDKDDYPYEPN